MSSIGKRPSLQDLLHILSAMEVVSAYSEGPNSQYFTFTMTIDRGKLQETVPDWSIDGLPKPRHFMEEVLEQLAQWHKQRIKEEQWVSREDRFGSSVESLIAWAKLRMEQSRKKENQGGGMEAVRESALYAATVLRLDELKQRREAGAIYSASSDRREKASKEWMRQEEERDEMLRRQKEQARERQRNTYGYGFSTGNAYDNPFEQQYGPGFAKQQDEWSKAYRDFFKNVFEDAMYSRSNSFRSPPPPPRHPGKKSWYAVLDVPVGATKDQIKKAYRRLASKYHPDRYKEADRDTKMTEINVARDEGLAGL